MPLLKIEEITKLGLMADLPIRRSATNQARWQIQSLLEGLDSLSNPIVQESTSQHVVSDGETLQIIATRLWGDPNKWRSLAVANGIDYPFLLYVGQVLTVPGER